MTSPTPRPETIDKLGNAVYSSFAMLAGMQLGLFTPLRDGPMGAEQLATAMGVGSANAAAHTARAWVRARRCPRARAAPCRR